MDQQFLRHQQGDDTVKRKRGPSIGTGLYFACLLESKRSRRRNGVRTALTPRDVLTDDAVSLLCLNMAMTMPLVEIDGYGR